MLCLTPMSCSLLTQEPSTSRRLAMSGARFRFVTQCEGGTGGYRPMRPTEHAEKVAWLFDWWAMIDRRIASEQPQAR